MIQDKSSSIDYAWLKKLANLSDPQASAQAHTLESERLFPADPQEAMDFLKENLRLSCEFLGTQRSYSFLPGEKNQLGSILLGSFELRLERVGGELEGELWVVENYQNLRLARFALRPCADELEGWLWRDARGHSLPTPEVAKHFLRMIASAFKTRAASA